MCYPYEMWLLTIDGGDRRAQGIWIPILPRKIVTLSWAVEIVRIDILLEVSQLSSDLALLRKEHLEQVFHIFGYLKIHNNMRLMFDCSYAIISSKLLKEYEWFDLFRYVKEYISTNMTESKRHTVSISMFVNDDLAGGNSTRRS